MSSPTHANGGLKLARNPHERTQAKKLHQDEVIDQHRTDKNKQEFSHEKSVTPLKITQWADFTPKDS